MQYGFILPHGDIHTLAELANAAEVAGWDGVFYWDGIYIKEAGPMYDPWIVLAAMALRTDHVRLGLILTPPSRRRPWKLARETVTLDHLSHGRLILPVGLGALEDGGFTKVGEVTDRRQRAELLDESLEILTGLWSGKPFSFQGKHYHVEEMTFLPPPVQSPRIPIWVVGAWPNQKSMQRVLRYDGLLPNKIASGDAEASITPEDIQAMKAYIEEHRSQTTPFDIVQEGRRLARTASRPERSCALMPRQERPGGPRAAGPSLPSRTCAGVFNKGRRVSSNSSGLSPLLSDACQHRSDTTQVRSADTVTFARSERPEQDVTQHTSWEKRQGPSVKWRACSPHASCDRGSQEWLGEEQRRGRLILQRRRERKGTIGKRLRFLRLHDTINQESISLASAHL